MNAVSPCKLAADSAVLSRFITTMFPHAQHGTYVSLRTFRDDKVDKNPWVRGLQLTRDGLAPIAAAAAAEATKAAQDHIARVFAPPVATFRGPNKAKAEDVACGLALSVECDAKPTEALATLARLIGEPTVVVLSGGEWVDPNTGEVQPKRHMHWRLAEPTTSPEGHKKLKRARDLACKLVGGDGTNIPISHPVRWPGSWHRKNIRSPRLATMETCNEAREIDLATALAALERAAEEKRLSVDAQTKSADPQADVLDVAAALAAIPNTERNWEGWRDVGMAVWRACGGAEAGFLQWDAWSAKCEDAYDPTNTREKWESFHRSPPDKIGAGTLFYRAKQHAPNWRKPSEFARDGAQRTPEEQFDDLKAKGPSCPAPIRLRPGLGKTYLPPPRPWVLGGRFLAGTVTAGVGAPKTAKSTMTLLSALAVATGRGDLTGEEVHRPGVAWVHDNEDDLPELERRLIGMCRQYAIDPDDLRDKLIVTSGTEAKLVFATKSKNDPVARTDAVVELGRYIKELGVVFFGVGPLVSLHRGVSENANDEMDAVVGIVRELAVATGCAIDLTHHSVKNHSGNSESRAGDMNAGRGASALIGAVRGIYTLTRMDGTTAAKLNLAPETAARMVRLDGAGSNYSADTGEPRWFHLKSVDIGNGDLAADLLAPSDSVGVPVIWDVARAEAEADAESASRAERARRSLLAVIAEAMPNDRCGLGDVLPGVEAHTGTKERKARDLITAAIPLGGNGRMVDTKSGRFLLRAERTGHSVRGAVVLFRERCTDAG